MEMKVKVAVDVVEREPGRCEFLELRPDFRLQLAAQIAPGEIPKANPDRVVAEALLRVDQAGNLFAGQRRMAAEQGQVQAHAQFWILARQGDRLVEGGFVD